MVTKLCNKLANHLKYLENIQLVRKKWRFFLYRSSIPWKNVCCINIYHGKCRMWGGHNLKNGNLCKSVELSTCSSFVYNMLVTSMIIHMNCIHRDCWCLLPVQFLSLRMNKNLISSNLVFEFPWMCESLKLTQKCDMTLTSKVLRTSEAELSVSTRGLGRLQQFMTTVAFPTSLIILSATLNTCNKM